MFHFFINLEFHTCLLIILVLLFVLFYEAINGFHDTANAVAIIIYTKAMSARLAVIMSGIFNFFGVLLGGLSVAYAIVHLLPTNFLFNVTPFYGIIMLFSLLLSAIVWNLATWYLGIPASSSHTLIGATIGVCITNSIVTKVSIVNALNIPKMINILISLIISPIIGFIISSFIIFIFRFYYEKIKKYHTNYLKVNKDKKKYDKHKPTFWIRIALIFSAIGVSFSHGANDGQKGIGIIMLVLICIAPSDFIININSNKNDITKTYNAIVCMQQYHLIHNLKFDSKIKKSLKDNNEIKNFIYKINDVNVAITSILNQAQSLLVNIKNYNKLTLEQKKHVRSLLICISGIANFIANLPETNDKDSNLLKKISFDLLKPIEYSPLWIIIIVALSLSFGTMFGWKRISITIGEKIGKKCITYAQGVSAQLTAGVSIGIASYTGMPVSTTQVLSSAVAGAMLADGYGLQIKTVKSVILTWLLTLPMSILLSSILYWILLLFC
ncbi:inorganic phosphate transporter [Candidatus Providencia siddallii]|uniref:Phosphate transporter n=1 Tax=Candidatus Providencia siddallii TaxID=1715285 RepID=A0ABM9NP97_9GAMM